MNIYSPAIELDNVLFDITRHFAPQPPKYNEEHQHTYIEIVTIIGGTAEHYVNGKKFSAYPGSVTIIPLNESHRFDKVKDLELYNVTCSPELFQMIGVNLSFLHNCELLFNNEKDIVPFTMTGLLFHDVQKLLKRLHDLYYGENNPERLTLLQYLFSMFLVLLSQAYKPKELLAENNIRKTAKYIELHYSEKLTLDELAKHANMSKNHFLRKFRSEFDTTPLQYLLDCRLKQAWTLLNESTLTIDQIAFAIGFCDSNYFIKTFSKHYGNSPGKCRNSSK